MNSFERYLKDLDNYLTRSQRYPEVDLDVVIEGLQYAYKTGKSLPKHLLYDLIEQMKLLRSGWDSELFQKREAQESHPSTQRYQEIAVSYVLSCRKNNFDEHPVPTIAKAYGVTRKTIYEWIKKYKDDAFDSLGEELLAHQHQAGIGYKFQKATR